MTVSIYKNVADTEGRNVDLFAVLTTNKWQHLTDKVRAETNKAKRNMLKQQLLPAFTPSGVFRKDERNNEGLVKHSGYMCIDIDGDDNPNINDWQSVVVELGKLPEVAFAGRSASGNGVFAIIPIKYPNRHIQHFKAFQKSFAKRGLMIDPKCRNVSRLRFYSYNEHYYINKNAKPYIHLYIEPSKLKYTPAPYSATPQSDDSDVDALVREIVERGVNIVPDYQSWFEVGAALSNVSNGRELFHRISQIDASNYNYKQCDKQFDGFKPGKSITINTLFYIAKNNGVTIKRSNNSNSFPNLTKPKSSDKRKLFADNGKRKQIDSTKLFVDWIKQEKTENKQSKLPQQQAKNPNPEAGKQVCYVDKDGRIFIPNPCNDNSFSVHKSVDQYNSRKGLPTFIDKDQVDISQMNKQYIVLCKIVDS